MKVSKSVEVSKESDELGQGLVSLVQSVKKALDDGFQAGEDIPAIILENIQSLSKSIEGADKIGDEYKEDPQAFLNAWLLAGSQIAGSFIKKDENEVDA